VLIGVNIWNGCGRDLTNISDITSKGDFAEKERLECNSQPIKPRIDSQLDIGLKEVFHTPRKTKTRLFRPGHLLDLGYFYRSASFPLSGSRDNSSASDGLRFLPIGL
jgi:hypothetical protein